MKKIIFFLSLLASFSIWALHPRLDKAVRLVNHCLSETETLLCTDEIDEEIKSVHMDARGEFVYFLKDLLAKNETEKVISNLFTRLQEMVVYYEALDGNNNWSTRDLKTLLGDVSIRYVKISPVDPQFLKTLYKAQAAQNARYGMLLAVLEKSDKVTSLEEMDKLVEFGEYAKDLSRQLKDEYYLYQTSVELIKRMTMRALKNRPGHEGVYEVKFANPEVAERLKLDRVVIMESNDRDALVVNFVSTKSRIVRFSFKGSGLLGDQFFSNEDTYHNDPDFASPFFKFRLDRKTKTITGIFATARLGKTELTGRLLESNLSVYSAASRKGLKADQLLGEYNVVVGGHTMTLVLRKRTEDRTNIEGALFNQNAMIGFSKVNLDSERGVLTMVDINNEKKLTLAVSEVEGKLVLNGQFMMSATAQILPVSTK